MEKCKLLGSTILQGSGAKKEMYGQKIENNPSERIPARLVGLIN